MIVQPIFALLGPETIGILVIGAMLLFGADKLPKLARSAGQARTEFLRAQSEAQAMQSAHAEIPKNESRGMEIC